MHRIILAVLLAISVAWSSPNPADAAAPLSVYGSLPGFERAALSPSGDKIAIIGVVGEQRRLLVVSKDNKLLHQIGIGNAKIEDVNWAGEERVLVRVRETVALDMDFTAARTNLSTDIVIPLDGAKSWVVFEKNGNITGGVRGFYGILQRDGRYHAYYGGITLDTSDLKTGPKLAETSAELYEVDLETAKIRRLAKRPGADGIGRDWLIGADGEVAATLDFGSRTGSWSIENKDGATIASGRNPLGGIRLISLGRTPGTIIYGRQDEATGGDHWFEVPLAGGPPVEVLADEAVRAPHVSPHNLQMIGWEKEQDSPEAQFFDPAHQRVMRAARKAFPGLNVSLQSWNKAFDRLVVVTDGPGDPGTWWLVDIKTGDAAILGSSYAVAPADVGPMRVMRYKAADGLEIAGVLTLPPGREARNLPVILFPHGGPHSRDYPGFHWWAQAFAARGYAVFQPNFRGSSGYGAAFERAGRNELGRKMQTDISDGLAELARQGIVDPKRACIMGGSYGGYAALAGVTLQQGLYRCAVSFAGVSDYLQLSATEISESGRNPTMLRILREDLGPSRDLKTVSPRAAADRADAPILLVHGKEDTVVLFSQSSAMESALRKAGKQVELVALNGGDHWLSTGETRTAMLKAAVEFVERHNPADPPAAK